MSQKINAKNLQYNIELPPFLARLRGQNASETDRDGPDPILAARRRPVKPRSASADAEDAPLVVDEQGNSVEVTIGADGSVKEESTSGAVEHVKTQEDGVADNNAGVAPEEKLASIGEQRKKRKIGKVIGAGADDEEAEGKDHNGTTEGKAKKGTTTASKVITKDTNEASAAAKPKTKKKAKKIKLSFGDDEG